MTLRRDITRFYTSTSEPLGWKLAATGFWLIMGIVGLGLAFMIGVGILQLIYYYPFVMVPLLLVIGGVIWVVVHIDRKAKKGRRY